MGIRKVALYGMVYPTGINSNLYITNTVGDVVYNGMPENIESGSMPSKPDGNLMKQIASWDIDDETPIDYDDFGIITIKPTRCDLALVTTGSNKMLQRDWEKIDILKYITVKGDAFLNGEPYDNGRSTNPTGEDGAWIFICHDGQTLQVNLHLKRIIWPLPGYVYPPADHPDYQIPEGRQGYWKPRYDPAAEGKMIPSYIPDWSDPNNPSQPPYDYPPLNIPQTADLIDPPAPGTHTIFANDNEGVDTISIDIDKDNEPDIVITIDNDSIDVDVDDDIDVNIDIDTKK